MRLIAFGLKQKSNKSKCVCVFLQLCLRVDLLSGRFVSYTLGKCYKLILWLMTTFIIRYVHIAISSSYNVFLFIIWFILFSCYSTAPLLSCKHSSEFLAHHLVLFQHRNYSMKTFSHKSIEGIALINFIFQNYNQ